MNIKIQGLRGSSEVDFRQQKERCPHKYTTLIILAGSFGIHRFYLGQLKKGMAHLSTALLSWFFLLFGLVTQNKGGSPLILIGMVGLFFDLTLWFKDYNSKEIDFKNRPRR